MRKLQRIQPPVVLSIAALGLGILGTGWAQELEQFSETVEVRVVNVEVMVTDRNGNTVTGLSRKDFEIFEDGERVELTNFFAVEGRQPVVPDGASAADFVATPETQNLSLVIFIDNLNMRPENRNQIFENLKEYLHASLDPRDRVMLVVMDDSVDVAETFTSDPYLLSQTLDRLAKQTSRHQVVDMEQRMVLRQMQRASLTSNPASLGGVIDGTALADFELAQAEGSSLAASIRTLVERRFRKVEASVRALSEFTDSLAGLPGRKAVLYMSDGLNMRAADSLAQAWLNKYEMWALTERADDLERDVREMSTLGLSRRYDASRLFNELVAHASDNHVAFYPISAGSRAMGRHVSAEFGAPGTANGQGPTSADVGALEAQSLESSLVEMATGTGGLAFTRTTRVGGLLDRMIRDFESFYSLGYRPPHGNDGESHRIEVKVRRAGLSARHLGSYRLKDPMAELQDRTLSALRFGLVDNVFEMRLDPGPQQRTGNNTFQVPIQVKIPFYKLLLLPQDGYHVGQLSIVVVARDTQGRTSAFREIQLPIRIPDDELERALRSAATYEMPLEMREGWQRISVGVRDHLAQLDGTMNLEIEVGAH